MKANRSNSNKDKGVSRV